MGSVAFVEDNSDSAELLTLLLEVCGIRDVHCFSCGKDFLAVLEERSFDLVLLDISLPDMDGYAILRQFRETNRTVPVIAVSANASEGEREKGLQAGFAEYVTKPILDIDGFFSLIRSHVIGHLAA